MTVANAPGRALSDLRRGPAAALVAALAFVVPLLAAPATDLASAPGETFRIAHWDTVDGLPQSSVTDVLVLANGEMWLATFGGLVRFDGLRFDVLDMAVDDGLPSPRIVGLEAASADGFWYLTQSGHLGRIERGRTVGTIVAPPNATDDALGLAADGAGELLARLRDGSLWRTNGVRPWLQVAGRPPSEPPHLAFTTRPEGGVSVAWGRRLMSWRAGVLLDQAVLPSSNGEVFASRDGVLWLGLGRTVARLRDGRVEPLTVVPPLGANVTVMAAAGDGALWVGARGDLSRLEPQPDGTWRRYAMSLGLDHDMLIRTLEPDDQGSVWVGTDGQGLYRISRTPVRRLGPAVGLIAALGMASDGDGGAFVARSCLELDHIDRLGSIRRVVLGFPIDSGADIGCGLAVAQASADSAWVRFGGRLLRVTRPALRVEVLAADLAVDEGPVVTTPDGALWVASRNGIVQQLTPEGRIVRTLQLTAPLVSAAVAPDGTVWIGGDGRVDHVVNDRVESYGAEARVPRGLIRDLLPEVDGTVWIGAYGGGVGRLRGGRVARLTVAEGLPDNSVSRILTDGRGRLWISTNRGIAVVDRTELVAVADGARARLVPVVFGPERGVAEANFGSPAGFAADGLLWFSTIEGPIVIDGAGFPSNAAPPAVRFDRIWADDRMLPLAAEVAIPPLTGRVRLDFSASERLYPEALRFRYRIEGVDADWVSAGNARTVNWTPPRPGRHRVLVDVRSADGIWSTAPAVVLLDVRPTWWQQPALRATAAGVLLLAGVAGVRWRIHRLKQRHAAQLRALEQQRETEGRVASLRLQLEHVARAAVAGELAASLAHEVRQPIGAMVNNAEAGRRHLSDYLQRPADIDAIFSDIVADGLRASEVINGLRGLLRVHGPDAGAVDLSVLVREVLPIVRGELNDAGIALDLDLADHLPDVDGFRVQLGQLVLNLLLNSCEALSAYPGERRVTISTAGRDGWVDLSVHDSGPGPSAAVERQIFEPFVTTKADGLGMGLAICRSIAEAHGGRLSAERPSAGGYRMTLSLPATDSGAPS